jgi:spore coat protein CotH
MTTRRLFRGGLLLACSLAAAPASHAQSVDDLFGTDTVHEIRLSINSRDLAQLREEYLEDTYYSADLSWRNTRVRNIAIRSRGGHGSRSGTKVHLRLDFNRYTSGQTFLGMKAVILKNLWQQPSMIAEHLAMSLFGRMGQPVPRESFCRLYINNIYQGLYAIVEAVDADFLARTVNDRNAHLFSYQFDPEARFWGGDLGDDYEPYKARFEAETHEREPDAMLYGPIRELFRQVTAPVDSVWRDRVGEYVDLRQFVTHVAIETFLAELDGVLGANGMNNFYLYRPAGGTLHRMVVWDKDQTFSQIDRPIFQYADDNELFRRASGFDDLRRLFLDVLEECARSVLEEGWLSAEIERLGALVGDAAREDPLKPFTNEEFEEALEFLRAFARERPAFVRQEIDRARPR